MPLEVVTSRYGQEFVDLGWFYAQTAVRHNPNKEIEADKTRLNKMTL
jgi:hypothetical protein